MVTPFVFWTQLSCSDVQRQSAEDQSVSGSRSLYAQRQRERQDEAFSYLMRWGRWSAPSVEKGHKTLTLLKRSVL